MMEKPDESELIKVREATLHARLKVQLFGVFVVLVGATGTVWGWYTALYRGYYEVNASIFFPYIGIFGLGLIAFRDFEEERIARGEDISQLSGMQLVTPRWWVILAVGLAAGLGNMALHSKAFE